jgi:hypothetical protein
MKSDPDNINIMYVKEPGLYQMYHIEDSFAPVFVLVSCYGSVEAERYFSFFDAQGKYIPVNIMMGDYVNAAAYKNCIAISRTDYTATRRNVNTESLTKVFFRKLRLVNSHLLNETVLPDIFVPAIREVSF